MVSGFFNMHSFFKHFFFLLYIIFIFSWSVTNGQSGFTRYDSISVSRNGNDLAMPWAGGLNAVNVQEIDLNGDVEPELVLFDRMAESTFVFSKTGQEYIADNDLNVLLPEDIKSWLMFADVDCDGDRDLFTNSASGVRIYENTSTNGAPASWEILADPLLTTGFSGKINLSVSGDDIPVIDDVDGDGDVDIIVFNFALGGVMIYHKNMAVEHGQGCGAYDFVVHDRRWGEMEECGCEIYAFDGLPCPEGSNGRTAHEGGNSLFVFDEDGDGDKDLLMGHSVCEELVYFENEGDASEAKFTNFVFGKSGLPGMTGLIYPGAYKIGGGDPGPETIIITANLSSDLIYENDYSQSVQQYERKQGNEVFSIVNNSFLQEEMLDFGAMSQPLFVDVDGDLDMDLLVASSGIKKEDGRHYGGVAFIENTGTRFNPVFEVKEDDFLQRSDEKLIDPVIAVTDFNDDGLQDLFFAGFDLYQFQGMAYLFWGNDANNGAYRFSPQNMMTLDIELDQYDAPAFYDVDGDGDEDMIVGKRDGSLNLFDNTGDEQFELKTPDYLGIGRDFSLTRLYLHPIVDDLDQDGKPDLITADMSDIKVYYDFTRQTNPDPVPLQYRNMVIEDDVKIRMQRIPTIATADLDGSGAAYLLTGGVTGGLQMYKGLNDDPAGVDDRVLLFPNPVRSGQVLNVLAALGGSIEVYDIAGRHIGDYMSETGTYRIDPLTWQPGIYILRIQVNSGSVTTRKVIRQ